MEVCSFKTDFDVRALKSGEKLSRQVAGTDPRGYRCVKIAPANLQSPIGDGALDCRVLLRPGTAL